MKQKGRLVLRARAFGIASYWLKVILQPLLAVTFVAALAWSFGYLQRNHGWFRNGSSMATDVEPSGESQYACSMLCVFVGAPGRCPVCGMELQKIEPSGDPKDVYGVTIDSAARRLANIKTVAALNMPVSQESEVFGRVETDETGVTQVSAYIGGRIEELLVDYTGAEVQRGDAIAVVYSPDLYTDQIALLQARSQSTKRTGVDRIDRANTRLYESARRRLIEKGLPQTEVDAIEKRGTANSRIRISAPASGTVVEKLVEEGKYVEPGMPILKLADLSTVWLMLEMFPEDASDLKLGQSVDIDIQSLNGRTFEGSVSFVEPSVDVRSRTISVRVAIPNEAGLIKVGDLGRARIRSELQEGRQLVVVPRESILRSGSTSIAYVETEPGRFEFRQVTVEKVLGERIVIAGGIEAGEQVVSSGAFMLDSTFAMQGKVSLIDPNRSRSTDQSVLVTNAEAREIEQSFASLSDADRLLARSQVICPVTEVKLGTMGMGTPIRVDVMGTPVMICCEGCRRSLLEDPIAHFETLKRFKAADREPDVSGSELPQMELPQMELPQMELPQMELPQMEAPE
ncbi:MAG: efflux RND transporter periplasmic adaptor subunit [Planctomycetota bacterium]